MNLSNMSLRDLKALKRDIEDEIEGRQEKEAREIIGLLKEYLGRKGLEIQPSYTLPIMSETKEPASENNLMNTSELANKLGVPKSQIYRLASRGDIPLVKIGKYNRYDLLEVLAALDGRKID